MSFIEKNIDGVVYMTSPNIETTHAFTTRIGGVSTDIYATMNLGLNLTDDHEHVKENYRIICRTLGITEDSIVFSNQIHGANVRLVTREDCGALYEGSEHESDALITCDEGVALTVFVGDCVPILLHDPVRRAVGAIHAGWRGTAKDISGATVRKMVTEFDCSPADIRAAIGPSISKCCYETDRDVAAAMKDQLQEDADTCVTYRNKKYMVDLKESNRLQLHRAGVNEIMISDECTFCLSEKYWSHRITKGRRGSQAGIIIIN